MSKLKKKMFRDIKLNKSQFIAIFLMVFLGVLVYGGVRSYMDGMINTAEVFYRENNLEDLNVVGNNFSKDDLEKIKNMENVNDAERKLTITGTMEYKEDRFLQLNFIEENKISKFYVMDGEGFDVNKSGVWLDNFYAQNNDLKVGDTIKIKYDGETLEEKIVGLINVPDHVYDVKDESELFPNHENYGFAYMSINEFPEHYVKKTVMEKMNVTDEAIFDMYVNQSMGITSISRQLANLGVLSKKNTPLHPTTIARMLRNHTYIGKIVWNKSKSVKGKNTQEKTSKDDWLYVPGLHEPIIDEDTFNKAQDIINLKYKPPMRTGTLQNPFAGLLKCANCGRAIVINTSNETVEKYRLCCRTLGCNKASALSIVEDKVFEVLTKEFKDIELSLKNIRQSHNKDKLSCLDTIATLETELKKLDKQQLRLYDLLEQEVYTKELFLERNNAISDRRKKINATIAQEREKFKLVDTSSIEERLPLLRELLTNYHSLSAAEKNSILKNFVKKIEYKREKSAPEGDIFLKIYYK